jgi:hypothetical protein
MSFNSNGNTNMNYTIKSGQRYYNKTVDGVVVTAWKDGCSIGVRSEGQSAQYFDDNNWSMKKAMEFYAKLTN